MTKPSKEAEWPEPQQAGETDNAFFLRVLEAHRQSHLDWAEFLSENPTRKLAERLTKEVLGSEEAQQKDVARYDKLIEIFTRQSSELARVRGLLQRLWAHIWNDDGHGNGWFPDERCKTCIALYEEMKAEGAESADIGKLDAADKSGVEMGKVSRVEENLLNKIIELIRCPLTRSSLDRDGDAIWNSAVAANTKGIIAMLEDLLAGSAETGGEKA